MWRKTISGSIQMCLDTLPGYVECSEVFNNSLKLSLYRYRSPWSLSYQSQKKKLRNSFLTLWQSQQRRRLTHSLPSYLGTRPSRPWPSPGGELWPDTVSTAWWVTPCHKSHQLPIFQASRVRDKTIEFSDKQLYCDYQKSWHFLNLILIKFNTIFLCIEYKIYFYCKETLNDSSKSSDFLQVWSLICFYWFIPLSF